MFTFVKKISKIKIKPVHPPNSGGGVGGVNPLGTGTVGIIRGKQPIILKVSTVPSLLSSSVFYMVYRYEDMLYDIKIYTHMYNVSLREYVYLSF